MPRTYMEGSKVGGGEAMGRAKGLPEIVLRRAEEQEGSALREVRLSPDVG